MISQQSQSKLPDANQLDSKLQYHIDNIQEVKNQYKNQRHQMITKLQLKQLVKSRDALLQSKQLLKQIKQAFPHVISFQKQIQQGNITQALSDFNQLQNCKFLFQISQFKTLLPTNTEEFSKTVFKAMIPKFTNFLPTPTDLNQSLNSISINPTDLIIKAFTQETDEIINFSIQSFSDFHFFASKAVKILLVAHHNILIFNNYINKQTLKTHFLHIFSVIFSFKNGISYDEIPQFRKIEFELEFLIQVMTMFFSSEFNDLNLKLKNFSTIIIQQALCQAMTNFDEGLSSLRIINYEITTLNLENLIQNFQNLSFSGAIRQFYQETEVQFQPEANFPLNQMLISVQNFVASGLKISLVSSKSFNVVLERIYDFLLDRISRNQIVFSQQYKDFDHVESKLERVIDGIHKEALRQPSLSSFQRIQSEKIKFCVNLVIDDVNLIYVVNNSIELFKMLIIENRHLMISSEPILQKFSNSENLCLKYVRTIVSVCFNLSGLLENADVFIQCFGNFLKGNAISKGKVLLKQEFVCQCIEFVERQPDQQKIAKKVDKLQQKLRQHRFPDFAEAREQSVK